MRDLFVHLFWLRAPDGFRHLFLNMPGISFGSLVGFLAASARMTRARARSLPRQAWLAGHQRDVRGGRSLFGRKLFIHTQAFTSVASAGKRSSNKSGLTSRWAGMAAMTLRDIPVLRSRQRFMEQTARPVRDISPEGQEPSKQQVILQRATRRRPFLQNSIAEQRTARLVRALHRHPRHRLARVTHVPDAAARPDEISTLTNTAAGGADQPTSSPASARSISAIDSDTP